MINSFRQSRTSFINSYGLFTLPDTDTDKDTDNLWVVQNCVKVFILHRDRQHQRFPLGPMLIYQYLCLSRSLCLSWCQAVSTLVHTEYKRT